MRNHAGPFSSCNYHLMRLILLLVNTLNLINLKLFLYIPVCLGPFCGNVAPSPFTIPSNHVIVEFNADNSDNYAGFKANWKAV